MRFVPFLILCALEVFVSLLPVRLMAADSPGSAPGSEDAQAAQQAASQLALLAQRLRMNQQSWQEQVKAADILNRLSGGGPSALALPQPIIRVDIFPTGALVLVIPPPSSQPSGETTGMPMRTVLQALSDKTRVSILADPTVFGAVKPQTLAGNSLAEVLSALGKSEAGLRWQCVYLPQDKPVPDAATLALEVQMLQALSRFEMVLVGDQTHPTVILQKTGALQKQDRPAHAPAGMREVWLVWDETIRRALQPPVPTAAP